MRAPPGLLSKGVQKMAENKNENNARPVVTINGVEYRLRFDLYALESIEEEFGGAANGLSALRGKGSMKAMKTMFAILANSQRNMEGLPEDVTGDEIDAHAPLSKVMEIVHAIEAAADEGKKTETVGGPADDRKENPLEKEYNEQKGKNV